MRKNNEVDGLEVSLPSDAGTDSDAILTDYSDDSDPEWQEDQEDDEMGEDVIRHERFYIDSGNLFLLVCPFHLQNKRHLILYL